MPPNEKNAKKEALNLFEEEEKRQARRARGDSNTAVKDGSLFDSLKGGAKKEAASEPASKDEATSSGSGAQKKPAAAKPDVVSLIDEEISEDSSEAEEVTTGSDGADGGSSGGENESGEMEPDESKIIHIKPPIIVKELAEMMDVKAFKLMKDLMELDVFVNQNQAIEPEVAAKVCEKHGYVFEKEKREKGAGVHKVEEVIEEPEAPVEVEEDKLQIRPPVVTFMGHVDHGKTSLLDAFRGSKVVAGEAGGITQHIGAYSVKHGDSRITFVDTPGHQAFTEMRARGANVTDIVILVIAADDGIMPTTEEAIDHAKAADVSIIIAINKVDLPRANVDKVKGQLQERGLTPEDRGGKTLCVEVSAKEGTGLDDLLETILLQAEVMELRASEEGPARGSVIEGRMDPGRGPTATLIIQSGVLEVGTPFICGNHYGKVKSLIDDGGNTMKKAGPATPVEVLGFSGLPNVGDELVEMESERKAKKLSDERLDILRQEKLKPREKSALETLFANIEEGTKTVLKLILKTDAQGSGEAIVGQLQEIESEKITLDVIRTDAGPITESDILLASASDAIVVGFCTKVENKAVSVAKREGVQVKLFSIIYELIDQVKEAMLGMLEPETREHVIGHAVVKEVFKLSSGRVGGCMVTDGRIARKARARVLRGDQPVYDGGLATLRRFKDDVKEVRNGLECGIRLGNFNDYMKDDVIECYELEKIEQTL